MEMRFPLKSWQNKDYFLFRPAVEENCCMIFARVHLGASVIGLNFKQQLPVTDLVMINGNYTDFAVSYTDTLTHIFNFINPDSPSIQKSPVEEKTV